MIEEKKYSNVEGYNQYIGEFLCEEINDNKRGFSINISDKNDNRYIVHWVDNVESYRKSDEGSRWVLIDELKKEDCLGKLIIECKNSDYISWITSERYGNEIDDIKHIIILSSNDIVDVICYEYPEITQISNG